MNKTKITVMHSFYGCDSGCCGHVIYIDDKVQDGTFEFSHPYDKNHLDWAKKFISDKLGPEHVQDLDWENCAIDVGC